MNEMMYMPLLWLIILGTAILSAIVTQALPSMPKWWNAFKDAIRRVFTRKDKMDMVDVVIIAKLQERIDELEEQVNNLAKNHYRRETNRKNNKRQDKKRKVS